MAEEDHKTRRERGNQRLQRLQNLMRRIRSGAGFTSEMHDELKQIIDETQSEHMTRPTREDAKDHLRELEAKYGPASREELLRKSLNEMVEGWRSWHDEVSGPSYPHLKMAIHRKDAEAVRTMLAAGLNPNCPDCDPSLLALAIGARSDEIVAVLRDAGARVGVIEAAMLGEVGILRELLDSGDDPNPAMGMGLTALYNAARYGRVDAVRLLLERGAHVDVATEHGQTPLHAAATQGHTEVVDTLIAGGAHVGIVEAALLGDIERVRAFLDNGESIETRNAAGRTALISACEGRQVELARLLLARGANPNSATPFGQTPLFFSAYKGSAELIDLLLNAGVDVNALMTSGDNKVPSRTVLHLLATARIGAAIVRYLIERGADPNVPDTDGRMPILHAVLGGDADVVRALAEAGADVNGPGTAGWPLLIMACDRGDDGVVRALLENGANPNTVDSIGKSALLHALHSHPPRGGETGPSHAIVRALLDAGADPNLATEHGGTALTSAVAQSHVEIVRMLLDAGADPNYEGKYSGRALDEAVLGGHNEIADMLRAHGAVHSDLVAEHLDEMLRARGAARAASIRKHLDEALAGFRDDVREAVCGTTDIPARPEENYR